MTAADATDSNQIESDREVVASLAEMGIARLGRAWQLLLKGHAEIGQAPHPSAACEMLIIRLAHAAMMPTPGDLVQKITAESAGTSSVVTTSANPTSASPTSAGAAPTGPSDPKGQTPPHLSQLHRIQRSRRAPEPSLRLSDLAMAAATPAVNETEAQLPGYHQPCRHCDLSRTSQRNAVGSTHPQSCPSGVIADRPVTNRPDRDRTGTIARRYRPLSKHMDRSALAGIFIRYGW